MDRVAIINGLIGRPYDLGGRAPGSINCYGCARILQREIFGRDMPDFAMPGTAGRQGIAAAIAVHPERGRWQEIGAPEDGALVTMARNDCGYHIGTWLAEDGGIIVHALEVVGVVADTTSSLQAVGWRRFRFHRPL
ncbi:glycoside hydrolase [uncultured Devosia sp.]|uniref:glycoside hydrolase n=1 Tax=uncultured Devosia sp. TaxID=211434 RepID=UPI00262AABC2|nr:glycoside hydrolase [uncultured Devosia sp.]